MDCVFCRIANGDIPTHFIYADDEVVAFNDLHPQAPEHKIIIPRQHIATWNDIDEARFLLTGKMVATGVRLAKELGIAEQGYRLVTNCNADGGQTVFHIHLHLLGGRHMTWPPG